MDEQNAPSKEITYRVRFFRTIVNDSGARFPCAIDTIDIRRARTQDRALSAAMRRFERRNHVAAWRHLADGYGSETIPIDLEARYP